MSPKKRRIIFLTGTRADFGKLKSLIESLRDHDLFEPYIFATGMHMNAKYGMTVDEIKKVGYRNLFTYYNHTDHDTADVILAKTIEGFSHYVKDVRPDLIILHGDRVEALAGAIVGALNNILTAHIEGGEVSGTVDEFIRHSVSKMSHVHFVANQQARQRLIQMGEEPDVIFTIGSPDIDIMLSNSLPTIDFVKQYYEIPFSEYAIMIFHPVTTELDQLADYAQNLTRAAIDSLHNFIVIYPNNDAGSEYIFASYEQLQNHPRFKIFPSTRFEYFVVLLRHAKFIVGNSSSGIREAPYFGIPTVNIGTRQKNRSHSPDIINTDYQLESIATGIRQASEIQRRQTTTHFGQGNSSALFLETLISGQLWTLTKQKQFKDLI